MKVVLFCGGFGMRLREYSESVPKPLVPVGYRPILWHLMKYYAHFGHTDFILCLGWKADAIKDYFLNYNECLTNDFVLSEGGRCVSLLNSDIDQWRITFVDTGANSNIGERLLAVRPHLEGEKTFLANYSDGLSDLFLPKIVDFHQRKQSVASFVAVKPMDSFHTVTFDESGSVSSIRAISETECRINAGFFVLDQTIFDYIGAGEDLVGEPFDRLIEKRKLHGLTYDGFFACMDTFKQKQLLDDMFNRGETPWAVWEQPLSSNGTASMRRLELMQNMAANSKGSRRCYG